MEKLLSVCEIADALGRSESYVWAMRRRGFVMPGGRATLVEARAFLIEVPHPRSEKAVKVRN
jgi:hypothetical protein